MKSLEYQLRQNSNTSPSNNPDLIYS